MEGFFNLPKVRRKAIPPPVGVASAAAALHSRRRSNLIHLPERNASIPWAIRMPMLRIMKVPASAAYIPSPSLSVLNGSTAYTIKTICHKSSTIAHAPKTGPFPTQPRSGSPAIKAGVNR
jgi:hypothetical protein